MKQDFFNLDEYKLYGEENINDELLVDDSIRMYLNSIARYPLLTKEEEKKYLMMLNRPKDKKLLSIKKSKSFLITDLDIQRLFYSLCNSNIYQMVINTLIEFYGRLNSINDKTISLLQRYLKESSFVNRALNPEEIKNIFNLNIIKNVLSEKDLLREIKSFMDYKFAFDKVFISNLRLVTDLALRYQKKASYIDLINEGNMGLMKAIQRYDINYGVKFSTYATYCIYSMIRKEILLSHSIVRLPFYFTENLYTFKKNLSKLEVEEGKTLSSDEISKKLNIPLSTIKLYYDFIDDDVYIDSNINNCDNDYKNDDDDLNVMETIPYTVDFEEKIFDYKFSDEQIEQLLFILREKEAEIIKMYFGLGEYSNNAKPVAEIAKELNVTRQCINQIKVSAMKKLKQYYSNNDEFKFLKDYIKTL